LLSLGDKRGEINGGYRISAADSNNGHLSGPWSDYEKQAMHILVSYRGAPNIRGWETGAMLARAFRRLGHDVDEYAKIYQRPEWVTGLDQGVAHPSSLLAKLKYASLRPRGHARTLGALLSGRGGARRRGGEHHAMLSKAYDLHVYCECNDGDPQYLELKDINAKRRVAWLFDVAMRPAYYQRLVAHMAFQRCYIANLDYVHHFSCVTSYLPYAADLECFGRPLDTPKTMEVCLVGSDRPARRELIQMLQQHGIRASLISGVFKEHYINMLAASKIVINDIAGGGTNLLSMRAFEAPAAGAMLVQASTPALRPVFADGSCCVAFATPQSLIAICHYYLAHDEERKQITKNGQDWVMQYHAYEHRARKILNDD
jgi:hypothetical protein